MLGVTTATCRAVVRHLCDVSECVCVLVSHVTVLRALPASQAVAGPAGQHRACESIVLERCNRGFCKCAHIDIRVHTSECHPGWIPKSGIAKPKGAQVGTQVGGTYWGLVVWDRLWGGWWHWQGC